MELKHTAGPWVFEEKEDTIWVGPPKQVAQGNCGIDDIIVYIDQYSGFPKEYKELNRANAKLIAAAPEMFEVVKELYDWAIEHKTYGVIFPKLEAAYKKVTE